MERLIFVFLLGLAIFPSRGRGVGLLSEGKGWMGVIVEDMSPAMLRALGIENGVLISEVLENSPAEKAGLKVGDVIISLDGERISTSKILLKLVRARPNKRVEVEILRQLKREKVILEIGIKKKEIDIPEENIEAIRRFFKRFDLLIPLECLDSLRSQIEELREELRELKKKLKEKRE